MGINNPKKIIVHHFASLSKYTAQDCDSWHKVRWPGFTSKVFKNDNGEFYHVGYHFVIESSGKVVQCRELTEEGAHCIGQNTSSIGIALAGNFDIDLPTKAQEKSFRKLVKELLPKLPGVTAYNIYPHRKYANKSCYGSRLSDTYFTQLMAPQEPEPIPKELYERVVQLATQLLSLLTSKQYSNKQI